MTKPYDNESAYRNHVAKDVATDKFIAEFLRSEGLLNDTDRLGEWWEDERHSERMIVNYFGRGQEEEGQIVTSMAILWADDPHAEHVRECAAEDEEHKKRLAEAAKTERRGYIVVWEDDSASERAALRRLLAKYPQEAA